MGRLAEQERAAFAFGRVQQNKDQEKAGDYRQLVMSLPAMIQQCGLGQTMAFLASKGKGHHAMALNDLREWLKRFPYAQGKGDVLQGLMAGDSRSYRMATTEALAYLQWLKRFAEAAIDKPQREPERG